MMATKITNVKIVVTYSLDYMDWRDLYTVHDGCKDYKCEFCGKLFTTAGHLKKHIHTIHEATKITNVNLVASHLAKK